MLCSKKTASQKPFTPTFLPPIIVVDVVVIEGRTLITGFRANRIPSPVLKQYTVGRQPVRFASQAKIPVKKNTGEASAWTALFRLPGSKLKFMARRGFFAPLVVGGMGFFQLGFKKTFSILFHSKKPWEALREAVEFSYTFEPPANGRAYHEESIRTMSKNMRPITISVLNEPLRITGWYLPPKGDKPTIVFATGKQGKIGVTEQLIQAFEKKGFGFMTFDYRGYGTSEGHPSEEGVYNDFRSVTQYLEEKLDTPLSKQVAFGYSLGGAVVSEVAQGKPFKAVVLCSTFTTPEDTIPNLQKYLKIPGFIPLKRMMHPVIDSQWRTIDKVPKFNSPFMVFHGAKDRRIDKGLAQQLFEAGNSQQPKDVMILKDHGHTSIFEAADEIVAALEKFLNSTH